MLMAIWLCNGSGDVVILINVEPIHANGKTKAEVLQQLPANSIEPVEVIYQFIGTLPCRWYIRYNQYCFEEKYKNDFNS
jgi:hypothetical protein